MITKRTIRNGDVRKLPDVAFLVKANMTEACRKF